MIKKERNLWVRTPVSHPVTHKQIVNLFENFQKVLKEEKIKNYGISTQRNEIYFECFDELVRHSLIKFKSRGLLLSLVRDYFK